MRRIIILSALFISFLSISTKADIIDISVLDMSFSPANVNVNVGDQIRWTLVAGAAARQL